MTSRIALVSVLALTAGFAVSAYAATPAATTSTMESPATKAVDADVGKLSTDGAAAFRDVHMTRLAIFDANPTQAKTLIGKAQAELAKAKTDETVFTKAEADLKPPATAGKMAATAPATNNPDAAKPIQWLPIDGQLALDDDFVATPQKAAAVADANKSLATGDKKAAIDKLKLADINVSFTLAVVPLMKTTNDVDQAATMINDGKYYEANAMLKQAEDGVRFDMVDLNETPKAKQATAAAATPATPAPTPDATKPAK